MVLDFLWGDAAVCMTDSIKDPEKATLTSVADPVPSPTAKSAKRFDSSTVVKLLHKQPGTLRCPQLRFVEESAYSTTSSIIAPGSHPSPEAM